MSNVKLGKKRKYKPKYGKIRVYRADLYLQPIAIDAEVEFGFGTRKYITIEEAYKMWPKSYRYMKMDEK